MRTYWKQSQIDAFRQWHDKRLTECGYSESVQAKLRNALEVWLPKPEPETSKLGVPNV